MCRKPFNLLLILLLSSGWPLVAYSQDFDTTIEMLDKGAATFYVNGEIDGVGPLDLMVDTGSGYMTINEETLAVLLRDNRAEYVKQLAGTLADGSKLVVPVYRISSINIGGQCWLHDVEAAVFPGKTRAILGLSALSKAAPFIFSLQPPQLVLSNCAGTGPETGDTQDKLTSNPPVVAPNS